jgi:hypothetical protein
MQVLLNEAEDLIKELNKSPQTQSTADKTSASLYDTILPQERSAFMSQESEFFNKPALGTEYFNDAEIFEQPTGLSLHL